MNRESLINGVVERKAEECQNAYKKAIDKIKQAFYEEGHTSMGIKNISNSKDVMHWLVKKLEEDGYQVIKFKYDWVVYW